MDIFRLSEGQAIAFEQTGEGGYLCYCCEKYHKVIAEIELREGIIDICESCANKISKLFLEEKR